MTSKTPHWWGMRRARGLSLIEVMVTMVIIATLFGLALPAIRSTIESPLEKSAGRIASIVDDLRFLSVLSNTQLVLKIDPDKNSCRIFQRSGLEEDLQPHPKYKKEFFFEDGIEIGYVSVNTVKSIQEPMRVNFDPLGFGELFEIALLDEQDEIIITWVTLTGKKNITGPRKRSQAAF